MKAIIRIIVILTFIFTAFTTNAYCQNTDEDFLKVCKRMSSHRIFCLDRKNIKKFKKDFLKEAKKKELVNVSRQNKLERIVC